MLIILFTDLHFINNSHLFWGKKLKYPKYVIYIFIRISVFTHLYRFNSRNSTIINPLQSIFCSFETFSKKLVRQLITIFFLPLTQHSLTTDFYLAIFSFMKLHNSIVSNFMQIKIRVLYINRQALRCTPEQLKKYLMTANRMSQSILYSGC